MKIICFTILLISTSLQAQHSPYFYKRAIDDWGITTDEHARFLKRVCFRTHHDEWHPTNVLKKNDAGDCIEFNGNGTIEYTAYLEHSTKFYYDRYLQDPKKTKKDWDYSEFIKLEDHSYTINSQFPTVVFGALTFVIKVNGNEIASYVLLSAKTDFMGRTSFTDGIWNVDLTQSSFEGKVRNPTIEEKYKFMRHKDSYFPLMYYMRDFGTKGSHKIEVEVYPAKIDTDKATDRTNELICKGEFTLTLSQADIDEIKKAGGPKYEPNTRVYPTFRGWFNKI